VPESSSILKSVTTKSLVELAKGFGWRVEMRAVPWPEVNRVPVKYPDHRFYFESLSSFDFYSSLSLC
jgi:hypothetical protein